MTDPVRTVEVDDESQADVALEPVQRKTQQ